MTQKSGPKPEVWFRIGERVREYRLEIGYSQAKLAAEAGISLQTLIKLETGRQDNPRIATLIGLAYVLDVGLDSLIGFGVKTKRKRRRICVCGAD